jgi:signal transduction histidine kinase/CheY-like chemotaxis protein
MFTGQDRKRVELQSLTERVTAPLWLHPALISVILLALPADWRTRWTSVLLGLAATHIVIAIPRFWLCTAGKKWIAEFPGRWSAAWWSGTCAVAATWGTFFAWCYCAEASIQPAFVVCHAGLCAGGMTSNVPSYRLMVMFQSLLILPSVAATLLLGPPGSSGVGLLMLLFYAFLLGQGRQVHRRFWHTYDLRAEVAKQNVLLRQTNEQLADANRVAETNQAMLAVAQSAGRLALWDWDITTGFAQCNEQWFVLHGISSRRNPVTFADWLAIVHPDDKVFAETEAKRSLNDDVPYCSDYRILGEDGSLRWVNSRGRVWRNDSGAPIRMVGASVDITERMERERFLRQHAEELQEAMRAKSAFLAHMSHEIRTPMNGVLGMADLLATTGLNEEQQGFVQTIRHSGAALVAVINDILDFSKIEAGKLQIESIPFNLHAVLEECVQLLADSASTKGNVLRLSQSSDLPVWVMGDPGRIRQIVLNLLSNAIKFTAGGSVTLRTESNFVDIDRVQASITVTDTGIGISEEAQSRLFQPFSQADSSTTRLHGGTGLGLAISKTLAEMMGGSVSIRSQLGIGSAFSVSLPFSVATRQETNGQCNVDLAGKRVAAFETDPTDREILSVQLRALGLRVDWKESLSDLTSEVASGRKCAAALISLDCVSEEMLETVGEIRAAANSDIPVALITSTRSANDQQLVDQIGNAALIRKPVRGSVFHASLEHLLLATRSPSAEVAPPLATNRRGSGIRILVAEDNLVNQRVAASMLAKLGYEVEIAANGAQAVEAVQSREFGAILMDGHMPVMDGTEATRRIRSSGSHSVPIIALSASALAGDRESFLAAGMDDYLAKPVQLEELARALDKWVGHPETVDAR